MKAGKQIQLSVAIFLLVLSACQLRSDRDVLQLKPPLHKTYKYSLLKTSESYNKNEPHDLTHSGFAKSMADTFKLNFTLENIALQDSLIICKLTFHDFFKSKRPFKVTFSNVDPSSQFIWHNPFELYDSLTHFINGKSIHVTINHRGVVKKVTGVDNLIKSITLLSSKSSVNVKQMTSDYLSIEAIKDLINSCFSPLPGFKVNEGDQWISNVILVTKAPVKVSNLNMLEQKSDDTAYVSIRSVISATQSEGDNPYLKGKGRGIAMINATTGMPYLYETRSETLLVTTRKEYERVSKEHLLIKEYN